MLKIFTRFFAIYCIFASLPLYSQKKAAFEHRLYKQYNKDRTYSFKNYAGEVVSKYMYDAGFIGGTDDYGYAGVRRNGLYGYVNYLGAEFIPCVYPINGSELYCEEEDEFYFIMQGNNTIDLYNSLGEKLYELDLKVLEIQPGPFFGEQVWLCNMQNKWGAINVSDGKQIIPFIYDSFHGHVINDKAVMVEKDGCYGFIDSKGKVKVPFIFKEGKHTYGTGGVYVDKAGYLCIVSSDYKICKTEKYEDYGRLREGRIGVKKNKLWGFIDEQGKQITEYKYTEVFQFSCGIALVCDSSHYFGWINHSGKEITDFKYNPLHSTYYAYNDIAIVYSREGKCGAINTFGQEVIPCEYDAIHNFKDNPDYTTVEINGLCGIISRNGEIVLPIQYEYMRFSRGHIAAIRQNDKWGYINIHTHKMLTPFKYDDAYAVSDDGLASVYINKNEGAINSNGVEVIPCGENFSFRKDVYLASISPSDVDENIPINKDIKRENTFVVIIANENYLEYNIPQVEYAKKDGSIFKEYCVKTLSIPADNIRYRENTTLNQIRYELNWLKKVAEAYNGEAKVIFYYAGHGMPDESNSTAYILPSDGFGSDINSAYSLNELYRQLGNLPAQQVTVFMDACFSGAKRNGKMLTAARSVAIKAKSGTPKGNMVVFSAAQGDETAYQYNRKKHGLFTYFLLKKLQETKGDVNLKDLEIYIRENVQRCSIRENGKKQTPTMQVSPDFQSTIEEYRLQ